MRVHVLEEVVVNVLEPAEHVLDEAAGRRDSIAIRRLLLQGVADSLKEFLSYRNAVASPVIGSSK